MSPEKQWFNEKKNMEIFESTWYDDFECQAENCPENCCSGWMVPLTREDRERFCKEKGSLGRKLKREMFLSGGEQLNMFAHRCTFLNREGLCTLQGRMGAAFIPEACRNYPRFYRNYGPFEERYIDLSCIHGARLFLQTKDPLGLRSLEGAAESRPCSTNDDGNFLTELRTLRGRMLQALDGVQTPGALADVLEHIFRYCQKAQAAFARGHTDFFSMYPFLEEGVFLSDKNRMQMFPFPLARIRALMETSLYHFRLRFHNPRLYSLCRLYLRKYAGIMDTDDAWEALFQTFIGRYPQRVRYYSEIYGYYLLQHFLGCYDDYCFQRNAGLGIVHINMLMLFEVLHEREYGEADDDVRAGILSAYVRRAYYNSRIPDELYAAAFLS